MMRANGPVGGSRVLMIRTIGRIRIEALRSIKLASATFLIFGVRDGDTVAAVSVSC